MTYSVVIPAYNEEDCLEACIRSVRDGSEQPLEIIVADGGSTDNTVRIAERMGAAVVNNEKKHAAAGRNAGISAASGDVIVFLDADCTACDGWLREIKNAFESEELDGLGVCIKPAPPANIYEEFWGTLSLQILMSYGDEPYYVKNKTLNEAFITASCAYKKELLQRLGGFSDYFANNAEDIDLCWRALDAGAKLKYVPEAKILARSPGDLKGIRKKSFRNGVSSSKLQKVYSKSKINFDGRLYKALFSNIAGVFRGEKYAKLFVYEIVHHLAGKYAGSVRCHVINF